MSTINAITFSAEINSADIGIASQLQLHLAVRPKLFVTFASKSYEHCLVIMTI